MSAELKAAERFCADVFSTFGRAPKVNQVQDLI